MEAICDIKSLLDEINRLPRDKNGITYISALQPFIGKLRGNHALAVRLWETEDRAARTVAVRIASPAETTNGLLESWVLDLDEWGLTDAFSGHLVKYTPFAVEKAFSWAGLEEEFVRRAGFSTIAQMAWAKNDFPDQVFIDFLPLIEKTANDERCYVKKAVNWALRDIGKRNGTLNVHACALASRLQISGDKTVRWVGRHRCAEFFKTGTFKTGTQ